MDYEMNLRDLSAEAMLVLSQELVDPDGEFRPKMEADTFLAGPCKLIVQAHAQLLPAYEKAGASAQRIRYLTRKMAELDASHDHRARAIYLVLENVIALSEGTPKEQDYRDLKETLFPKGRGIVRQSYRDQAGTAKRVQKQLTDEHRDLLREIGYGKKNLLDDVEIWLDEARRIAKKQAQRARLQNDEDDDAISAGEVQQARFFWVNAVNSLVDMVDYSGLDDRERKALLANIRDAARNTEEARRRVRSEDAGEGPQDGEAPSTDVTDDVAPAEQGDEDSEVLEPAE